MPAREVFSDAILLRENLNVWCCNCKGGVGVGGGGGVDGLSPCWVQPERVFPIGVAPSVWPSGAFLRVGSFVFSDSLHDFAFRRVCMCVCVGGGLSRIS